jgi:acyl carrier protein
MVMTNPEKYNEVFSTCFQTSPEQLEGLTYQSIQAWDSIGHMALITALEESFNIMIDTDDIIDFSSYQKGKEILKKYDIVI